MPPWPPQSGTCSMYCCLCCAGTWGWPSSWIWSDGGSSPRCACGLGAGRTAGWAALVSSSEWDHSEAHQWLGSGECRRLGGLGGSDNCVAGHPMHVGNGLHTWLGIGKFDIVLRRCACMQQAGVLCLRQCGVLLMPAVARRWEFYARLILRCTLALFTARTHANLFLRLNYTWYN